MIKISVFSKSGNLLKEKTLKTPIIFSIKPNLLCNEKKTIPNIHDLHNCFKKYIGKIFGVSTYTIADNDILVKELLEWENNSNANRRDDIITFWEMNNLEKKTTVLFNDHSIYICFLSCLQMSWFYYQCYVGNLFFPIVVIGHIGLLSFYYHIVPNTMKISQSRYYLRSKMNNDKLLKQMYNDIKKNSEKKDCNKK